MEENKKTGGPLGPEKDGAESPARAETDPIDDSKRDDPGGSRRRSTLKGVRVLVVDDDRVSLSMTRHILESHGCVTRGVVDGLEALHVLRCENYEVVIMDVEMPRLDGPEATRAIRRPESEVLDPRVPIIGLTSLPKEVARSRCLAAGMDDYLTKPVDPCLVYNAILRQIMGREES